MFSNSCAKSSLSAILKSTNKTAQNSAQKGGSFKLEKKQTKKILKKIKINESTISMILGIAVLVVTAGLIINYFKNVNKEQISDNGIFDNQEVKTTELPEEPDLEKLPINYEVQLTDNLWKISEKFYGSGYNWVDVVEANNISNPDMIDAGMVLVIPQAEVIKPEISQYTAFGQTIDSDTYTVEKGDHLWGIAVRAYGDGYQWVKIAEANNIQNANIIEAGQSLSLPR
jgi:nucleoid-associated protein YgaU